MWTAPSVWRLGFSSRERLYLRDERSALGDETIAAAAAAAVEVPAPAPATEGGIGFADEDNDE